MVPMVPFLPFFFRIFSPAACAGLLGGWYVGFEAERPPSGDHVPPLYTCCGFSCRGNEMLL